MMKRTLSYLIPLLLLCSCAEKADPRPSSLSESMSGQSVVSTVSEDRLMTMTIDSLALDVVWEENESTRALKEKARDGVSVSMHRYGGFEQVGELGFTLPSSDEPITTSFGDIVLYQSNQIVVFYGSNSWSYTRLGHIEGKTQEELRSLLAENDVTLTLNLG